MKLKEILIEHKERFIDLIDQYNDSSILDKNVRDMFTKEFTTDNDPEINLERFKERAFLSALRLQKINFIKFFIEDLGVDPIKAIPQYGYCGEWLGLFSNFKESVSNNKEIITYLLNKGIKINRSGHEASNLFANLKNKSVPPQLEFLKFLLNKGLDLKHVAVEFWRLLFSHKYYNHLKLMLSYYPKGIENTSFMPLASITSKELLEDIKELQNFAIEKDPTVIKHIKDYALHPDIRDKYSHLLMGSKFDLFGDDDQNESVDNYPKLKKRKIKTSDHEKNYLTNFKTWYDNNPDKLLTKIPKNKFDTEKTKEGDITVWGAPTSFNYIRN